MSKGDSKGYMRGAKGIDGNKGSDFVNWGGTSWPHMKVLGSDGGPKGSKGNGELQSSAKGK